MVLQENNIHISAAMQWQGYARLDHTKTICKTRCRAEP